MKAKLQSWHPGVLSFFLLTGLVACPTPVALPPDNDGIPDSAEVAGSTFAGLDLYALGARVGQRDIFLEIDHMNSSEVGLNPQKAAFDKIVAAFAAKNIVLHIDAGDVFSASFDPSNYNLGNTSRLLPYNTRISLTPKAGYASVQELKSQHFDPKRNQIFYYMVMGSSQNSDGSAGSSGRAEILGNDGMVSFGGWALNTSSSAKINQLNNIMASTIMHEFGHNLGLRHGGDENKNYKTNYVSIMNYMYQLDCIGPTSGQGVADRYFRNFNSGKYPESSLVNNARSSACAIDFSNGGSSALNENTLNENAGMGRGAAFVDWNDDGAVQTTLSLNLNPKVSEDGDAIKDTHADHDDWTNIRLGFANLEAVDIGKLSIQQLQKPLSNLNQEVSQETPPSPEYFLNLLEQK